MQQDLELVQKSARGQLAPREQDTVMLWEFGEEGQHWGPSKMRDSPGQQHLTPGHLEHIQRSDLPPIQRPQPEQKMSLDFLLLQNLISP
jgi:hypothetical protein